MANKLVLNNTPIRTSVSYKINNITLNDLDIPTANNFANAVMNEQNVSVSNTVNALSPLVYGVGTELVNSDTEYNSIYNISPKESGANFELTYTFDDNNLNLTNLININADKDMDVKVIYRSNTDKPCFHNSVVRVNSSNEANVHVELVNFLNNSSEHFYSIENIVDEKSYSDIVIIDMGAKNSVGNLYTNLIGKKANSTINTVYIGKDDDVKDINYIAHLRGAKSEVDMNIQGALDDRSRKNFKGTIDFKSGCKGAVGSESEYCMLLSDDVSSIALPILLCTEDDVNGSHSAASGQADLSQVFYLMTRGFTRKEAIKILVKAGFYKITQRIKDIDLQNEILEEIDRRL